MESICESCINYRQELIERGLCRAQDLYNHYCEIESENFWTADGCASYKPRERGDGMAYYDPDEFFHHKKPTNADRIRQAKNKEMTCDYILVNKTRRPCPVSPNCTAYRPGKKRREWEDT